jgi:hypothetical protein
MGARPLKIRQNYKSTAWFFDAHPCTNRTAYEYVCVSQKFEIRAIYMLVYTNEDKYYKCEGTKPTITEIPVFGFPYTGVTVK